MRSTHLAHPVFHLRGLRVREPLERLRSSQEYVSILLTCGQSGSFLLQGFGVAARDGLLKALEITAEFEN